MANIRGPNIPGISLNIRAQPWDTRGVSGEILLLQLNYVPDRKVRRVWTPLKFHCEIGRVVLLFGADFRRRKQRSATSADDLSSTKRSIAVSSCK